jgi:hypothetical protein
MAVSPTNVCSPDGAEQRRKRRKNNKIDARNLASELFNYLNEGKETLQLARVPTEAQEHARFRPWVKNPLVSKAPLQP